MSGIGTTVVVSGGEVTAGVPGGIPNEALVVETTNTLETLLAHNWDPGAEGFSTEGFVDASGATGEQKEQQEIFGAYEETSARLGQAITNVFPVAEADLKQKSLDFIAAIQDPNLVVDLNHWEVVKLELAEGKAYEGQITLKSRLDAEGNSYMVIRSGDIAINKPGSKTGDQLVNAVGIADERIDQSELRQFTEVLFVDTDKRIEGNSTILGRQMHMRLRENEGGVPPFLVKPNTYSRLFSQVETRIASDGKKGDEKQEAITRRMALEIDTNGRRSAIRYMENMHRIITPLYGPTNTGENIGPKDISIADLNKLPVCGMFLKYGGLPDRLSRRVSWKKTEFDSEKQRYMDPDLIQQMNNLSIPTVLKEETVVVTSSKALGNSPSMEIQLKKGDSPVLNVRYSREKSKPSQYEMRVSLPLSDTSQIPSAITIRYNTAGMVEHIDIPDDTPVLDALGLKRPDDLSDKAAIQHFFNDAISAIRLKIANPTPPQLLEAA